MIIELIAYPVALLIQLTPTRENAGRPASFAKARRSSTSSVMKLRTTRPEYDPTDRINAMTNIQAHAAKGEVLTGLLYVNPDSEDLHAHLNTFPTAFNTLGAKELCPGSGMLEKINAGLR